METDPSTSKVTIEDDVLPNVEKALAEMLAKSFLDYSCENSSSSISSGNTNTEVNRNIVGSDRFRILRRTNNLRTKTKKQRRVEDTGSSTTMLGLSSAPEDKMLEECKCLFFFRLGDQPMM